MKYKIIFAACMLCFFNLTEVNANAVFEGETWEEIIPCMGNSQQSIIKNLESNIKITNGIVTGLTDNYFVVIKNSEGSIIYQEPNYNFINYDIQVLNDDGVIEKHSITSVKNNPAISSHRSNNGTTLDLSRFSGTSYTYYIYVTDDLLANMPTDSFQYQAIVDTSRPGEFKFCNSLNETSIDETYTQVRPNISLEPPITVKEETVEGSYSDWIGTIVDASNLDQFTYDWAKEYWSTPEDERRKEYIENGTKGDDPLWCEETQVGFETKTYYYGEEVEVEDNSYCKVECVEQLSITYGEPVAILAGMGFSYDIKIDTIVDCETRIDKTAIEEEYNKIDKKTCTMVPSCWGGIYGELGSSGAGPNEDFDQCVIECDGGLYSEECSQKCYSKVYEQQDIVIPSKRMLVSPYIVAPMSDELFTPTSIPNNKIVIGNNVPYQAFNSCDDYDVFYNWLKSVVENPNSYISAGILTQAEVNNINNEYNKYKNSYIYYCTKDRAFSNQRFPSTKYQFILDASQGYVFRAAGTNCNASCYWSGNCPGGVSRTKEDIEKELSELKGKVLIALNQCSATVENMENEGTATYTSVITNRDTDDKASNPDSWKTELKSTFDDAETITSTTNNNIFATTIYRFPETYTNSNGVFIYPGENNSYSKKETELNSFYKSTNNQFLTSFKSVSTNTSWYTWHFENEATKAAIAEGTIPNTLKYTGTSSSYNIETELRDIGFFEWDFDVDCFYALENEGPPPTPGGGIEYVFRPIDLLNVFPNEDGDSDNLTANGRVPQWNWSAAAKETTVTGYVIDPIALTEKIEELGQDATYEEDPDYIITLDRQSISEIRDYNEKQGSYLNTEAECKPEADGRSVCNLGITGSVFEGVIDINSKVGCNNSKSLSECEIVGGN